MELVRKQTYITPEQDRRLKQAASQYGTTEAGILRRALDDWLATSLSRDRDDPFAGLIGFITDPEKVDHDDIYR